MATPSGLPLKVLKREGREVDYDSSKITAAVTKACASVGIYDPDLPARLTSRVEELVRDRYEGLVPGVEDVQNLVETTLIQSGYQEIVSAAAPLTAIDRLATELEKDTISLQEDRPRLPRPLLRCSDAAGR